MVLYGDYDKFTLDNIRIHIISPLLPFLTDITKISIDKLYLNITKTYKTDDIIQNYIKNCPDIKTLMNLLREEGYHKSYITFINRPNGERLNQVDKIQTIEDIENYF